MKWQGRRQSNNIEDVRKGGSSPFAEEKFGEYRGGVIPGDEMREPKVKNVEFDPDDPKEMKVIRELAKHNINKTTPKPTPRPKYNSQVTPGKWTTK